MSTMDTKMIKYPNIIGVEPISMGTEPRNRFGESVETYSPELFVFLNNHINLTILLDFICFDYYIQTMNRLLVIFGLVLLVFPACSQGKSEAEAGTATQEAATIGGLVMENQHDFPVIMSEEEWKKLLDPFSYNILREAGTERAFTGEYDNFYEKGTYYSAATGQPLFRSEAKYKSGTGWPSFFEPISDDAVVLNADGGYGMLRVEVLDSLSGSHLGHVFEDGPKPTGLRYCMNSASLIFVAGGDPLPGRLLQLQRRSGIIGENKAD